MRSGRAGMISETERLSYAKWTSGREASTTRGGAPSENARAGALRLEREVVARTGHAGALVARHDPDRDVAVSWDVCGLGRVVLAVDRDVAVGGRGQDRRQLAPALGGREGARRREELEGQQLLPAL